VWEKNKSRCADSCNSLVSDYIAPSQHAAEGGIKVFCFRFSRSPQCPLPSSVCHRSRAESACREVQSTSPYPREGFRSPSDSAIGQSAGSNRKLRLGYARRSTSHGNPCEHFNRSRDFAHRGNHLSGWPSRSVAGRHDTLPYGSSCHLPSR